MSTKPSLILTRLDVQRLERLIDGLDEKTQDSPGVLALQDELDRAEQQVAQQTRALWLRLQAAEARGAALLAAREASLARLDATRLGRQVGHRTTLELLNAESEASAAELALTQWRSAVALDRLRLQQLAGALDEATLAQP